MTSYIEVVDLAVNQHRTTLTDLCHLPAHELVRLMSDPTVSCRNVTEAHLARIEAVNPRLNALIEATDPERCLEQADEADTWAVHGEPLGRAHGLPVAVKDVMRVAGLACSGGSPVLRAVADDDATVVSRLRAEGTIVVGLTNVPEMGRAGESNNNLYGRTNNPYDLSRTPGGSIGGSAAVVAAGGAALSVGSDGGGSIRQPCHNTGIAGIKPTHGRIPRTGSVFGDALGVFGPFNCYGPLARSVRDLYLGLSIMNGPDFQDPYAVPAPLDPLEVVELAPLSVVTYLDDAISPPTDDVVAVVTAAADELAKVVYEVQHAPPTCVGRTMKLLWESVFLGGDRRQGFEDDLRSIGAMNPSEELAEFLRQARTIDFSLSEARNRFVDIDALRIEMVTFMADYDVIVCPAMPTPAKPHGHGTGGDQRLLAHDGVQPDRMARRGGAVWDLQGGAAHRVQIVGRPWQDTTVLAVAAHLEEVFGGWRRPPVVVGQAAASG